MARRRGVLASLVQIQREAERDRERRARAAAKGYRDAERAAAASSRASAQDQRLRDRLYTQERTREAAEDTAQLEQQVEVLQNVLAATLEVDDHLDLEALKHIPAIPAFNPRTVGASPSAPEVSDFAVEGPSNFGRVFAASKHAARAQQGQADYQKALDEHAVEIQQHAGRLEEARRRYDADASRQAEEHRQYVDEITALQRGLAERRPDAVVQYLDLILEAAEYPDDFPHSWRLGYATSSGHLTVDYELPGLNVVPADKSYKYARASDTINPSARPAAQARAVYAEVLRQTALRVVHEVMEADRSGAVSTVVFNGYVNGNDPATGREVRPCLIALATSRQRFLEVDLAQVDTEACLAHLEARVSKDPSKLQAIEPIVLEGSLQADYTLDTESEADQARTATPAPPQVPAEMVAAACATAQQHLVAGQNVPLSATRLQVDLQANHLDLSVLLVGTSGRVERDEDFIFYSNPRSANGAVVLAGNGASIDTALLLQQHERVVLVVSTSDAPSVTDATAVVSQSGNTSDLCFQPADSTQQVGALVWGELYLRNGAWRLRAVGQGWADGLAGLARDYGVDVE